MWVRIAGYGGSALLAAAAVAVLLMPLLDDGKRGAGTAGAQASAAPSAARPPSGQPASPAAPTPGRDGGSTYPGEQGDGGPPIPEQGGSGGVSLCPRGAASYRAARDGVDVVVRVSASGAVRAELTLGGGEAPESRQTTVRGGGQHTFHFTGVAPGLVQRVKVTTISVGITMQTCYARPVA
ncbi:hypothetical protein GCM10022254_69320 [Actinomadura meridiana]|uniref:Uncharacterized protein n=1 Tax=Actinomadura meridiana TaxID=559626 RepID=A0ABP8CN01_9ACTN